MFQRNVEVVNSADFISPLKEGTPTDDLHRKALSPAVLSDQVKGKKQQQQQQHSNKVPNLYIET